MSRGLRILPLRKCSKNNSHAFLRSLERCPGCFRLPCYVRGCIMVAVQELNTGTLLGHYRVVRRLGEGGMGVVYEAADQKLGRSVAIKLLPEATRQDPAALERFWREARTASSLNHAGICTIYELNESGD